MERRVKEYLDKKSGKGPQEYRLLALLSSGLTIEQIMDREPDMGHILKEALRSISTN